MSVLSWPEPPLTDGVVALRAWEDDDVAFITEACQDPEIPRWTRVPSVYTELDACEWLSTHESMRACGAALPLAIVEVGSGRAVGSTGLHDLDWENSTGEVGYWIAAEARRRGYARRAVQVLTRWSIEELGLDRLELLTDVENAASQRVARAAGYEPEGILRSSRVIKGSRRDMVLFAFVRPT